MSERILNQRDAVAIGAIVQACHSNQKVARLQDNGNVTYGIMRHVVRDPENAYFLRDEDDVRDGYLRVTDTVTGIEHFWPMADVIEAHRLGTFVFLTKGMRIMDPDATLEELRAAIAEWRTAIDHDDLLAASVCADKALEAADALDEWMTKGGFLPRAWAEHRLALR